MLFVSSNLNGLLCKGAAEQAWGPDGCPVYVCGSEDASPPKDALDRIRGMTAGGCTALMFGAIIPSPSFVAELVGAAPANLNLTLSVYVDDKHADEHTRKSLDTAAGRHHLVLQSEPKAPFVQLEAAFSVPKPFQLGYFILPDAGPPGPGHAWTERRYMESAVVTNWILQNRRPFAELAALTWDELSRIASEALENN